MKTRVQRREKVQCPDRERESKRAMSTGKEREGGSAVLKAEGEEGKDCTSNLELSNLG